MLRVCQCPRPFAGGRPWILDSPNGDKREGTGARIREKAEAEGLNVDAYVERLVSADQMAEELEALALEGLNSDEPIEVGPGYWNEKHRRLDERLKRTGTC
jgi:hypothetical protein